MALHCSNCGASLSWDGASAVVECAFCRTSEPIPAELRVPAPEPTLPERIEQLIRDARYDEAVRVLRDEFDLTKDDAQAVVLRIEEGGHPSLSELIRRVREGKSLA